MAEIEQDQQLPRKIAGILDESKASYATHNRKLKELSNLRSSSPTDLFFASYRKALLPVFNFQRRTASAECIIRFISTFACFTDSKNSAIDDQFFEAFMRFLLSAVTSANKTARFRSCQIISEIIMRLPDDAEVSNELWDEVVDSMTIRMGDKIPVIRTFAVRALSRFVNDSENSEILNLFIKTLDSEQNADVRKTILLALPPTNATSSVIIGCTLDVSESVRKAAYFVLANKFPLQSLSIKLRALILQRGLSDRAPAVVKECLKLMKDEWLSKNCNNNPIELLKYLDVETYESIGVSVMRALLDAGMGKPDGNQKIQQFKESSCDGARDSDNDSLGHELLEPEVALYWRVVCQHLQKEAQVKGSDAAATMGTEAAVYAAEASDSSELLEKVLPATVSDYVEFVQAHIKAGANYRFASRQLLLLGSLLDFSDATIRRIASTFVQDLLHKPLEYEIDCSENKILIGDGINIGGERDWANAVAGLAKKVHSADGEFEEVVLHVVEELARPCRERSADFMEWLHCLAVIGLLLENTKSLPLLQRKAIEPIELLNALLLPGAKHLNLDVQRVSVRCLGLYGLLEKRPSEEVVKQLGFSFAKGPSPISLLAGKGLLDLVTWHGPQDVDRAIGEDILSQIPDNRLYPAPEIGDKVDCNSDGVLYLLYIGLESNFDDQVLDVGGNESVQATLGEGFAKILLLSENYPSIPGSLHSLILAKLIASYFSEENSEVQRLKQCLSVFFEHYPSLSVNHKKHLSKAFVPAMRAMWPGINRNHRGSVVMISNLRKRAVQASRFMLQMMQSILYKKETDNHVDNPEDNPGSVDDTDGFVAGEEGLAIRIAVEVTGFQTKKTAAEKAYVAALCKIIILLHFRVSEQGAIKLMRLLLNCVVGSVSYDKELVKELTSMAKQLKALDGSPDEDLSRDKADVILGSLELEYNLDEDHTSEMPATPAQRSTRPTRSRRRVQREESSSSDEEVSVMSIVNSTVRSGARSQRACKTAALTKMTTSRAYDGIDEEEESDLTSDEEANSSDSSPQ
ncbi:condensin complex subunit 3-like [Chenopodium quinoa]|uniref:Nuclear condensin complex subunit 3 C-terminal domain-containing protein n=1 Tax=Chenopodium quinoa TaxID=63459 RepID=A0A803MZE9_CHEQI|nr:condensin complex subunit 3-like [Chenopodium quinoa]